MAATIVKLCGVSSCGIELETPEKRRFCMKSYTNDTISIEHFCGSIEELCEFVAGCFEKGSSFYGIRTVKMTFNGVKLYIDREHSNLQTIYRLYEEGYHNLNLH